MACGMEGSGVGSGVGGVSCGVLPKLALTLNPTQNRIKRSDVVRGVNSGVGKGVDVHPSHPSGGSNCTV